MKKIWLILLGVFISGCVSVDADKTSAMRGLDVPLAEGKKALTHVRYAYVGMTRKEVGSIMDGTIKIGYEDIDPLVGAFKPIFLQNPFRTEALQKQGETYDVVYYFTSIKKADGIVAEDELTPLIFKDNKLVGKGSDFLFQLRD